MSTEAPVFSDGSSTTRSIAENTAANTNIGSAVSATDVDSGDTLTYTTVGGTDAAAFDIDSETGQLKTKAALDYEKKTSYSVTITVSDGGNLTDTIAVTIDVTDVDDNRAPMFLLGNIPVNFITRSIQVDENTAAGANIGAPVSATDADNDDLTYTLGGTDASLLSIVSNSGQLRMTADSISGTGSIYRVTVTADDGNGGRTRVGVSIRVTRKAPQVTNNAPVFLLSNITRSIEIDGNTAAGANIGAPVSATDADNDTLTYTLGGTDATSFGIVSSSGQLQTTAAFISGTRSTYSVTVTANDGEGGSASVDVTVTATRRAPQVTNNDPVFTESSPSRSIQIEENTAVGANIGAPVSATDTDNDDLTYTLSGTDASLLSIVSSSGQLQATTAFISDTRSVYSVTVTANDGKGGSASVTVRVTASRVAQQTDNDDITAVSERTSQVRDAIVAAVSGVDSAGDVTETHLAAITRLGLDEKEISELQSGDFDGLTGMTFLNLYDNELTSLPADIFSGLTALKRLNVGYNDLAAFPANVFSGLSALEDLSLEGNDEMTTLPENLFSGLSALKELKLHFSALDALPANVFSGLSALKVLNIDYNSLDALPADIFDGLSALKVLKVGYNDLAALPADMFSELSALEELKLSGNHELTTLPENLFSGLTALKVLRLYDIDLDSNFSYGFVRRSFIAGIYRSRSQSDG